MGYTKLTTKEIENKINKLIERASVLADVIKDIKDKTAKATLQTHLNNYQTSISKLREELAKRHRE